MFKNTGVSGAPQPFVKHEVADSIPSLFHKLADIGYSALNDCNFDLLQKFFDEVYAHMSPKFLALDSLHPARSFKYSYVFDTSEGLRLNTDVVQGPAINDLIDIVLSGAFFAKHLEGDNYCLTWKVPIYLSPPITIEGFMGPYGSSIPETAQFDSIGNSNSVLQESGPQVVSKGFIKFKCGRKHAPPHGDFLSILEVEIPEGLLKQEIIPVIQEWAEVRAISVLLV